MQDFQIRRRCIPRLTLAGVALLALAACGGGGGGSASVRPPDPPPAAPPPTTVVLAPNPAFGKHLELTNTAPAHAAGITGQGVRIGVIDSGVTRNHPALAGRVTHNLNYVGSPPNNLSIDDVVGHGTAVSQIMAGTPFGSWPGGIAPGALIISARIISDKAPTDDGSGQGNEVSGALGLKPIHQDLIDRGARIMNNSWGGLYWTNLTATAPIADEYRPFVIANNGLVVFATGNSSFANPSSMAALPSQLGLNGSRPGADLERGWLAVAALDTDNPAQLASYSNACGVAMNYCLVAPGKVTVTGTDDSPTNPSYWNWNGTSLAAPQVSGAAALVWQAFPYFNNDLVRQTILASATDLGAPGVDAVFGWGLLNVGKAVNGPSRFAWGDVTARFDTYTSTWSNRIDGDGGIIKEGTGTLVLSGFNLYTGHTRVNGGTLRVTGSLGTNGLSSHVTVGPQGTLAGNGGITGNVENAGTLAVDGNAVFSIFGSYHQLASGRLAVVLGDFLMISGTAQLDGGALHVLGKKSYISAPTQQTVLRADGGLTGRFDSLTWAPNVFLTATFGYSGTQAWLDITRLDVTATAQSMGLSAMAVSSAERMERTFDAIDRTRDSGVGFGGLPVTGDFLDAAAGFQRTASAAAAERSLASLSGELHGADAALALMQIEGNRHALESRLDELRATPLDRAGGAWTAGLDGQRALGQLNVDGNGWVLGQDRRFGDRWMLGAAFGQSEATARHELRGDRERNRQLEGQLYAQWQHGDNYLLGRFAAGRMQRSLQREIVLGAEGFAVDSDYANRYSTLGLQAGRRFDLGDATLTPYVGVQALQLDRGGFTEHGAAGFGLRTEGSTLGATQALLGARLGREWQVGAARLMLRGRAEWQRALSQTGTDIDARFTAMDVWAPIRGHALDRDAGVFGMGLSGALPRWGRVSLDVDGRRERGQTHGEASARWSLAF